MRFRKLHGLGNDFVVVDCLEDDPPASLVAPATIRQICDRHRGVGADGVLLVLPSNADGARARMRVLNADGSEPQTCGNGIRCVCKLLGDHHPTLAGQTTLGIETLAGVVRCSLRYENDRVSHVRVDMGPARLERETLPMRGSGRFVEQPIGVGDHTFSGTAVSMGNPHLVIFVDDDEHALAERFGAALETHADFPERTNVELARLADDGGLDLVVWERGCGITQACGTGACAAAVAAVVTGRHAAATPLSVRLPGGPLTIEVAEDLSSVQMEGPATEVFSGDLELD